MATVAHEEGGTMTGESVITEKMSFYKVTVSNIMEGIVEEMCHNYCKWPEQWIDEMHEGQELSESDVCANCPLNRLV